MFCFFRTLVQFLARLSVGRLRPPGTPQGPQAHPARAPGRQPPRNETRKSADRCKGIFAQ
eukprot:332397-Alexandrium_andersonii.AAC.1